MVLDDDETKKKYSYLIVEWSVLFESFKSKKTHLIL